MRPVGSLSWVCSEVPAPSPPWVLDSCRAPSPSVLTCQWKQLSGPQRAPLAREGRAPSGEPLATACTEISSRPWLLGSPGNTGASP